MLDFSTFSVFALNVYRDNDQQPLPDGWKILVDCPPELQKDGYFGSAYIDSPDDKVYTVVIAHRGTPSSFGWSTIEDFEYWLTNKTPEQYAISAKPFIIYVVDYLKKNYSTDSSFGIYFTGHSLGAILAELSCAEQFDFNNKNFFLGVTYSYESPGSKPLIQDMVSKGIFKNNAVEYAGKFTTIVNSGVNAINTCKEHITNIVFLSGGYYHYDLDGGVLGMPSIVYYFETFTCHDQHKMINLYTNMMNGGGFLEVDDWPVGFENGYSNYYLSYSKLYSYEYWGGYTQYFWDKHPDMQSNYNHDYNNYLSWFVKQFLKNGLHNICYKKELGIFSPNKKTSHIFLSIKRNEFLLFCDFLLKEKDYDKKYGISLQTLLHFSVLQGRVDFVRKLLSCGANPNANDAFGNTPLHLSFSLSYNIFSEIAFLLIENGADISLRNESGKLPIDFAKNQTYRDKFIELAKESFVFINIDDNSIEESKGENKIKICSVM